MGQLLSKIILVLFVFTTTSLLSQNADDIHRPEEYKDKEQFEKFYKRRKLIGNWQINQLKKGALVVRLKTNKILVDALLKDGNKTLAEEKRLEMAAINLNTIKAYTNHYTFSKVYFIYSNSSDSLLRGARSNIFIDSTLSVNPAITMTEEFYLIAERDYTYNSSIGFVKEDSARYVVEQGNPTKEMAIVLKNKYGHQLKRPFPYYTGDKVDLKKKGAFVVYISIGGVSIPFNVGVATSSKQETKTLVNNEKVALNIAKQFTYEKLSLSVENFNDALGRYYQASPTIEKDKMPEDAKPFLY